MNKTGFCEHRSICLYNTHYAPMVRHLWMITPVFIGRQYKKSLFCKTSIFGSDAINATWWQRMATIRLQPPELFAFQKPDEWARWKRRFKQFRIASGLSSAARSSGWERCSIAWVKKQKTCCDPQTLLRMTEPPTTRSAPNLTRFSKFDHRERDRRVRECEGETAEQYYCRPIHSGWRLRIWSDEGGAHHRQAGGRNQRRDIVRTPPTGRWPVSTGIYTCRDGSGKQSTKTSVEIIITAPCTVLHYHPYISSCKPGLLKYLLQLLM